MIKVDRSTTPCPQQLIDAGAAELARHEAQLTVDQATRLKFSAYSLPVVKEALTSVFGRKCCFCEGDLLGAQPGDVEHYRPKGKIFVVDEASGLVMKKRGYFWLASEWSNLLISCADCNRPRTQKDHDAQQRVIGKGNYFPLEDEADRAETPAGLTAERPLLLNPCQDDPAEHLEFTVEGGIKPRVTQGAPSVRGTATIHYCGLARYELLQARAKHRRRVMAAVRHVLAALEKGADPGLDLDDLIEMLQNKETFAGYTRFLVRSTLGKYLEQLEIDLEVAD